MIYYQKVKCPECNKAVKGLVEIPFYGYFATYSAYCIKCDYCITESEWEEQNEN